MFRLFKKVWMPMLLVVVVALGMYAVVRIRDMFGAGGAVAVAEVNADTKPFNPKHITYEITGPPGGSVNVDFLDENGAAPPGGCRPAAVVAHRGDDAAVDVGQRRRAG